MDKATVIALAKKADLWMTSDERIAAVERFAALVETHLKDQGYRQCAKGQRTTQFCGMLEQAVQAKQEACANVADLVAKEIDDTNGTATYIAAAIRSRT